MASRPSCPTKRAAASLTAALSLLLGYAAATASATPGAPPRSSRTYVVDSTADTVDADTGAGACADVHHKCTLRAAIMQANFHPGPDVITIPIGTFTLTRKGNDDQDVLGDLDVTDSITLAGAGSAKTVIDGNGAVTKDRVLEIFPTATDTTIKGLTLRGGLRTATFDEGGGLLWQGGRLTVTHVTVARNTSYDAGGMALRNSAGGGDVVTLDHVIAKHNTAEAAVGGIEVVVGNFATFVMSHSIVQANKAFQSAGLYVQGPESGPEPGSVRVESTVFSDNHASGVSGGLEYHGGTSASLMTVTTSNFRDNSGLQGGAIGNFFGVLEVTRSTLEGNTARKGGALYDYEGALAKLTNTTLSHNAASDTGGGINVEFFLHGNAAVALLNSTLAHNTANTGGGIYVAPGAQGGMSNTLLEKGSTGANCAGNLSSLTSLSDDNSCGFGAGADGVDLELGPIGPHGGPTRTLVPQAGSPALDVGTVPGEPTIDQRGVARPMGLGQDIGAVEVCPQKPATPTKLRAVRRAKRHIALSWHETGCFETFSVVVRGNSIKGRVVQSTQHLGSPRFRTKTLAKGHTYFWRVTVVGDRGRTASAWHRVTVR